MIEFVQEPLSPVLEQKLRRWLVQPESDILRRIITSECQIAQAAALGKALEANPGDAKDLLLQDDLKQAVRYSTFMEILNNLATRPKTLPFQIAKLKPTTTYANITGTEEDSDN